MWMTIKMIDELLIDVRCQMIRGKSIKMDPISTSVVEMGSSINKTRGSGVRMSGMKGIILGLAMPREGSEERMYFGRFLKFLRIPEMSRTIERSGGVRGSCD